MNQPSLLDDELHSTALPTDVNDWSFNPTSSTVTAAPPVEDGDLGQNATHFVLKCQYVHTLTTKHCVVGELTLAPFN